MQQTLQLNIIPFTAPLQEAEFAFYTTKHEGYCPIHKDDCLTSEFPRNIALL
jgi:hypothetical protein